MVHPVVGRAGEPPVKPPERAHQFGVYPELVQQVDERHHRKHRRRHPGHGQRHVERPAEQPSAAGLAKRRAEVVVLALMVHHMRRPQQRAFMPQPVLPVVAEVVGDQRSHPHERMRRRQRRQARMVVDGHVNAHGQCAREHPGHLRQQPQAQAAEGIIEPIDRTPPPAGHEGLSEDHREEHGNGQDDDQRFHGALTIAQPGAAGEPARERYVLH